MKSFKAYDKRVPEFLQERPESFRNAVLANFHKTHHLQESSIEKVDNSNFKVKSFETADLIYDINFQKPTCSCFYFENTNIICKHFCAIFKSYPEHGWETLPSTYRDSPFFNIDSIVYCNHASQNPVTSVGYTVIVTNPIVCANSKENQKKKEKSAVQLRDISKDISDLSYELRRNTDLEPILESLKSIHKAVKTSLGSKRSLITLDSDTKYMPLPPSKKKSKTSGRKGRGKEMQEFLLTPKVIPDHFNLDDNISKCPYCDKQVGFELQTHLMDVHGSRQCTQCGMIYHIHSYCKFC